MNKNIILGAVFLAALAVGSYFVLAPSGPSSTPVGDAASDVETNIVDMVLGDDAAPITVVEYASYTCPHCATFHAGTFKDLKADYIETGKVKFIYREVYFDRFGLWGSIVARCGGQEKFFGITDLLYKQQSTWTKGTPPEIADNLRRIGVTAGLTSEQLNTCLEDGEKAAELVAWFEQNQARDGVQSTPSFVINGQLYANMSYSDFKNILDAQ